MKKIALIISMVALISLQGFSQQKKVSFGLKIGPTFDWASSTSTESRNLGTRLGFTFGGIIEHNYTNHIALSTGLSYNYWRGYYQFTDSRIGPLFLEEAPVTVNRQIRASYFEVPLKLKVRIPIIDGWRVFAEAGVGFSINTKDLTKDSYPKEGNELSTYWAPQPDEYYTAAYFYQYRWFQTALIAGLGAEFQINRKFSVFAQLSYNHALNNTFTRDIEELTKGNLHTNFIGIEIGAML